MGTKRKSNVMSGDENIKIVSAEPVIAAAETGSEIANESAESAAAEPITETKKVVKKIARSKKYQAVRSQVDKTKTYDPFAAIELVKKNVI